MARSWLILCLWAPLASAGPDPLATAERALRAGLPARAAAAFLRHLHDRPGDPDATVGFAAAASRLGRCDEALARLAAADVASARARAVEGDCHLRAGRPAEALASYDEALALDPTDASALVGAALAASARGDDERVEALLPRLRLRPRGGLLEGVVAAQRAYDRGSEAIDARLAELGALLDGRGGARLALLDARRWLDLDDPVAAHATLVEAARRHPDDPRLHLWMAEALRRLGDPGGARRALDRPIARRLADEAAARAVEARLCVDEGRLEQAREHLATSAGTLDPDAIASAWYLARATADAAEIERQARRWAAAVPAGRGPLEALVPVHLREGG